MAASVRSVSTGPGSTESNTITVPKPTGAVSGDVLFAWVTNDDGTLASITASGTTWAAVTNAQQDHSATSLNGKWLRRVCGGSEPSSYSFTASGGWTNATIICVEGADTTTPEDGNGAGAQGGSSTSMVAPAVSPSGADSLLLCGWAQRGDAGTGPSMTAPGSMTERSDFNISSGAPWIWHGTASEPLASSGSTGTRTATSSRSLQWLAATVAVKSAGGAAPTDLVVADLTVAHTVDAVTLTPEFDLTVADLTGAHTLDAIALTQDHELAVADMSGAHSIDSVTLTPEFDLTVADLTGAHTLDAVVLTQDHDLTVADLGVANTVDSVTLTPEYTLVVPDLTVAQTLDAVVLTQVHELAVADLTGAHLLDAVTLTQAGDLVVDGMTVAHTLDAIALTQDHVLVVDDLTHASTLEALTLAVSGTLLVDDLTVAHLVDALALTQEHELAVDGMVHALLLDNVALPGDGEHTLGVITLHLLDGRTVHVLDARTAHVLEARTTHNLAR